LHENILKKEMNYFAFCQGDILLCSNNTIPQSIVDVLELKPWHTQITFNAPSGTPCMAIKLSEPLCKDGYKMTGLRESFEVLDAESYTLAGKARELLYWNENTLYCGMCGSPMRFHTNISKRCTNCGKEIWPAIAPAIIVAITKGEEILLVQSKNFRGNYMGLVAGFVETGETLEDCVKRETLEETGITIKNIQYFASQAWPYPSGLMLGFTAEYESGELRIQRSELNKGGWFNLRNLPEIPGKVSLARQLIDYVQVNITKTPQSHQGLS
jgi:NAD+ diphosphatase